jgi:ribose transport system substrate-binding protein
MKRLNLVLLIVGNNDYQVEQTISAKEAARELGIDLQVTEIGHDAVMQSQEVLKLLHGPEGVRPNGILFEPVGTPLAQAAKIAASSGVGWVILNRETDYLKELRQQYSTPLFSVSTSHSEVGRTQGEQIAQLMPDGGTVLYIQGPSDNTAALARTAAAQAAKPANVELRFLRGLWTEESAHQAVASWLKLNVPRDVAFGVVAAQNDAMALGARRAFQELTTGPDRDRWLNLPFIGCDGLKNTGQASVNRGLLAATVVIPPNAGQAVKALAAALRTGQQPPECIRTSVHSFPPLASLKPRR